MLKITPFEKATPPEAEVLAARLYAMLPRIRITDLLSEVADWTLFIDCFTHLRSGETVADPRVLMTGLIADGLNLGLTRSPPVDGAVAWARLRNRATKAKELRSVALSEGVGGQTLGRRGFSKDHRPDLNQMILAVLLDGDGRPVCTEMWPGNTADTGSLIPVVDRLRQRFSIRRVCVVADRGMISAETIAETPQRSA